MKKLFIVAWLIIGVLVSPFGLPLFASLTPLAADAHSVSAGDAVTEVEEEDDIHGMVYMFGARRLWLLQKTD